MAAQSQHHQQYIGEPPTPAQGLLAGLWGHSAPLGLGFGTSSIYRDALDSFLVYHLFNYVESSR